MAGTEACATAWWHARCVKGLGIICVSHGTTLEAQAHIMHADVAIHAGVCTSDGCTAIARVNSTASI